MNNIMLKEEVDVVISNVLFLTGLESLDKYKIIVNKDENVLHCLVLGSKLPLARKSSRISFEWQKHHKILFNY